MIKSNNTCELVLKTVRSLIRSVNSQARDLELNYGLTGSQLIILQEIYKRDFVTTTKIAESLDINQSTATLILDKLDKKGLIERTRDVKDKRKWFITLTKEGETVVANAPTPHHTEFVNNFERLPTWQQTQILHVLQQVVELFSINSENVIKESAAMIAANIKIV